MNFIKKILIYILQAVLGFVILVVSIFLSAGLNQFLGGWGVAFLLSLIVAILFFIPILVQRSDLKDNSFKGKADTNKWDLIGAKFKLEQAVYLNRNKLVFTTVIGMALLFSISGYIGEQDYAKLLSNNPSEIERLRNQLNFWLTILFTIFLTAPLLEFVRHRIFIYNLNGIWYSEQFKISFNKKGKYEGDLSLYANSKYFIDNDGHLKMIEVGDFYITYGLLRNNLYIVDSNGTIVTAKIRMNLFYNELRINLNANEVIILKKWHGQPE